MLRGRDTFVGRFIILTMPDVFTKAKRSKVMAAIRSHGNKETELRLVTIFRGYRITGWRRHQPVIGKPDFVFQRQKLAIFVDGCFWHGCYKHCRIPTGNRKYWEAKISRNRARDLSTTRLLRKKGWRVLRIWSHALAAPEKVVKRVNLVLIQKPASCNDSFRST